MVDETYGSRPGTYGSRLGQETLRHTSLRKRPGAAIIPAPATDPPTLLDRTFGHADIAVLRHDVQERLGGVGVDSDRLGGFVLAVNEVLTNVVLHAGGHGRIVVWLTAGSAWCTVTDSGPGIPEEFHQPPEVPGAFETGGRGIWLAYQLCDEVTMATGPIGTTIGLRLAFAVPPAR
jgi:anti-sigma regulatory factor (Ser/Thr protein kinase)